MKKPLACLCLVIAAILLVTWSLYSDRAPDPDHAGASAAMDKPTYTTGSHARHATPPPLPLAGADRQPGSRTPASPPPLPGGANAATSPRPPALPGSGGQRRQSNLLHLRRAAVIDRQGFGRAMPALHLLIPADWREHGEVVWHPSSTCQAEARQFQWRAQAPDGSAGIEFLPGQAWERGAATPGGLIGCRHGDLPSLRPYLEQLARQRRPGATVTAYEDLSDGLTEAAELLRANVAQVPGTDQHLRLEAGQLTLSYVERGRRMRELIFAAGVFITISDRQFGSALLLGMVPAPLSVAFHAPEDRFDPRLVEAIAQSVRAGEEWNQRVLELDARITGNTIDEMQKRHTINMDTLNYIGNLNRSSHDYRIASQERSGHAFNQAIRGVETWRDPSASGDNFELPIGYANAWRLDDDSFIVTDNADFHPYSELGLRGRRLQRQR